MVPTAWLLPTAALSTALVTTEGSGTLLQSLVPVFTGDQEGRPAVLGCARSVPVVVRASAARR